MAAGPRVCLASADVGHQGLTGGAGRPADLYRPTDTRDDWPAAYDILLDHIAVDPPDLLLVTGDFVEDQDHSRPFRT